MNKISFLILTGLLSFVSLAFAQDIDLSISGEVTVSGEGTLYIGVFNKENFSEEQSQLIGLEFKIPGPQAKKIADKRYRVSYTFFGLKKGDYALKAFLDSNGNKKIDIGLFGPTEAWGFSNNIRHTFRGPSFDEVSFRLEKSTSVINFEVK